MVLRNRRGFIGRLLIVVITIILFLLLIKISRADTFTYYSNVTVNQNYTDFNLNLSNNFYFFYANNTVTSALISYPIIIDFGQINQTTVIQYQNFTSNVSCTNNTLQISCSCPSLSCPSVSATNCSLTDSSLGVFTSKIEEGYNKATNDIVFRLAPTQAEIDNLRFTANNATEQKNQALLEAAKQNEQNIRLGEVIQNERKTHDSEISSLKTELRLSFGSNMIMFLAIIYLLSDAYGLWDRLRNLAFRRGGH